MSRSFFSPEKSYGLFEKKIGRKKKSFFFLFDGLV